MGFYVFLALQEVRKFTTPEKGLVGACHHHHRTLKKTTMPFPPDFPRNSGESKQTGSESSFRLAGVSAPPKIPRIQWNVPRSVPRPPNLTTPAAHSEPHCEPRKEKLADVRCESVRSVTHIFFRDGGDSRVDRPRSPLARLQPQHQPSKEADAKPPALQAIRRAAARCREASSPIATTDWSDCDAIVNGLPSPPRRIANQKKPPCRRADASPFWDAGAERPPGMPRPSY